MSTSDMDWTKGADGVYRKTLRGYTGTITIETTGEATLVITGSGAPAPATYDTRKQAKDAFRTFLFTKPVT